MWSCMPFIIFFIPFSLYFLKIRLYFILEQFKLHINIKQKVQRFLIYSQPLLIYSLSHCKHSPSDCGTFVKTDELKLTRSDTPKPIVYIRIYSVLYIFYGLDTCIMVCIIIIELYSVFSLPPKILFLFLFISLSTSNPWKP